MPSMEEAEILSGRAIRYCKIFHGSWCWNFCTQWGPKGSYVANVDCHFRVAYEVEVSDTTGCGDSYCGGFIVDWPKGLI